MILPQSSIDAVQKFFRLSDAEAQELNENGTLEFTFKSVIGIWKVPHSRQPYDSSTVVYDESVREVRLTYVGYGYGYDNQSVPRDVKAIIVKATAS